MAAELQERDDPMERHLQAALESAENENTRYHLREAMQLRIAEKNGIDVGR